MIAAEKTSVLKLVEKIASLDFVQSSKTVSNLLSDLKKDMVNDFFTVVVLGEFKRGKSTFINSLLGTDLLPTDVLPETATINALIYNEEPILKVVAMDGKEVDGEATNEFLKKFSATNKDNACDNVKYIKIGYPSEVLKEKTVIVDTPGVSDINEQRCDITYRFIPKANVVIFLLDANSPLKNTEKEFIEKQLLQQGLDNILFMVNKYDAVDEDEEDGDLLGDLKAKMLEVFNSEESANKIQDIIIYPLSAKMALRGVLTGNEQLIAASGINEVKAALQQMLASGKIEQLKLKRYKYRLRYLLMALYSELENKRAMYLTDIAKLKEISGNLDNMLREYAENKDNIQKYVDGEKVNVLAIVDKSLMYFYKKLEENIVDNIQYYKAPDFKDYVEQRVAKSMQREMENWIASYSPQIDMLLKSMERELARGMSYWFKQKINLESRKEAMFQNTGFLFDLNAMDISRTNIKAGAIAAGGAGLMMMIGGSMLMPFISMAAFPFLQRKLLEDQLAIAKEQIIPQVQEQLAEYIYKLKNEIHGHIDQGCNAIVKNSELAYERILNDSRASIQEQIRTKANESVNLSAEVNKITSDIETTKALLQECQEA